MIRSIKNGRDRINFYENHNCHTTSKKSRGNMSENIITRINDSKGNPVIFENKNSQLIFFEGPNESRKTTLVGLISNILDIPSYYRGPCVPHRLGESYPKEGWTYVHEELQHIKMLKKIGGTVIFDRHMWISEKIYSEFFDRPSPLTNMVWDFSNELIFFCTNKEVDSKEVVLFERLFKEIGLKVIRLDTEDMGESIRIATGEITREIL